MTSKASKPSALKTFGIIIGVLAAIPVGFYLLWWIVVGVAMIFDGAGRSSPEFSDPTPDSQAIHYVYRHPKLENAFNPVDKDFDRKGDRIFFFEDGEISYSLKSYDLRDAAIVLWWKGEKRLPAPVSFAPAPDGESVYAYEKEKGLFLKTFPPPAEDSESPGKRIAPPIPRSCENGSDLFLFAGRAGVLGGCLPMIGVSEGASSAISVFAWSSERPEWSDRSARAAWKDGKLRSYSVFEDSVFLLGETKVHRFDLASRDLVAVADLKELMKDSVYQPHLGRAGNRPYLAAGEKLFFWGDGTSSFEDVLASSPSVRFWYDTSDSERVMVQGDEALIQVADDGTGRKGLGYFRKNEAGVWAYRGVVEDVSFAQPVTLNAESLYFADSEGLARRDIGLKTCRPDLSYDAQGAWRWIWKLAKGGEIAGYVLSAAPELCRIEIAGSSLRISLSSPESPSNFEQVRSGDRITASVARWGARGAVVDRVYIDDRGGAPVPGQTPSSDRTLTFALIALCFATGLVSIFWALKRMSQAARVCLARIFPTEESVRSADRLRTVGLAVIALGVLGLTMNLQGRPADIMAFLEAVSLQIGVFWVLFSVLYYVAVANLLKLLSPKTSKYLKPEVPSSFSRSTPPPPPPGFPPDNARPEPSVFL